MRIVTAQQLQEWLSSGKVLEKDARGAKVVVLPDGLFLKIFHTRRQPWLARLFPAAKRFADNCLQLHKLGISVPTVQEVFWLNHAQGLSGCLYQPLPGQSIQQILRNNPDEITPLLPQLAVFIKQLHQQGIYFRSLHLGNILQLPGANHFGLIDVLDLKLKGRALSKGLIKRNFNHLRHYLVRSKLQSFPIDQLILQYQQI